MADTATEEKPAAAPKEKLSPEERRDRVRSARAEKVDAAFKGKQFDYVEVVSLSEGERYTDVTGNKGRHGHKVRNTATGEELTIGPASLKTLQEDYKGINGVPEKKVRAKADKSTDASDEVVPPVE